jgi:hypothetical protein
MPEMQRMTGTVRLYMEDGVEMATLEAADFRRAMRERDEAVRKLAEAERLMLVWQDIAQARDERFTAIEARLRGAS